MRQDHQLRRGATAGGTALRCTNRLPTPGPIAAVRAWQERESTELRAELRRAAVLRHLRTVCEDADELLGRVTEATRTGDAAAALEPLGKARDAAATVLRALRRPVPRTSTAGECASALDEDQVLVALGSLEELDEQLRDAGLGYRGAWWRAARLAERLIGEIDQLASAAMTGRTRARGDVGAGRRG